MPTGIKIQQWQINYVEKNYKGETVPEMAGVVGLSANKIYVLCNERGWEYKTARPEKKAYEPKKSTAGGKSIAYMPDPPKQKFERPPAVYSNGSPYGIAKDIYQ